jgi:hypothetical protein
MACSCKSNNGAKKQATQVTKRSATTTKVVQKTSSTPERKQIVIRRPVH